MEPVFAPRPWFRIRRVSVWVCAVACCAAAVEPVQAGYTHYFEWNSRPDTAALEACLADMAAIVAAADDILADADGKGDPWVSSTGVAFNGRGDSAHEPFVFPGDPGFNFCKTACKPYDDVVTACLIVARDHFSPNVLRISSDGGWADWQAGARLYTRTTGKMAVNPFAGAGGWTEDVPVVVAIAVGLVVWSVYVCRHGRQTSSLRPM